MASIIANPEIMRLRWQIEEFNYSYAETLDRGDIEAWPDFFTEDGVYRLMARDNAEAALPLSLISCEGMGMLKDRAYAIAHTEMFAPRYVSHHVSQIRVIQVDGEIVTAQASYIILETLTDEPTRILQSGRYFDKFLVRDGNVLLKERCCIYDTVLVPVCVVYPP